MAKSKRTRQKNKSKGSTSIQIDPKSQTEKKKKKKKKKKKSSDALNNSKKRKRSRSDDNVPAAAVQQQNHHKTSVEEKPKTKRSEVNDLDSSISSTTTTTSRVVVQWLEKRKKKIPDSLQSDKQCARRSSSSSSMVNMDQILKSLSGVIKERERRALVRHVEKCMKKKEDGDETDSAKKIELQDSDGEYDINDSGGDDSDDDAAAALKSRFGDKWPTHVEFSNSYRWDAKVPKGIKDQYAPPNQVRPRAVRLSKNVYFKKITDPDHPAHGEFGLYCALEHAKPGAWLLDYVGHVTLGEDQNKKSDYVSDFGEKSELACDANVYGNEARFLNDFRNTGRHPNVEFNKRRDKRGELRQGVFVKLQKDSKERGFDGVRKDEELLVSYGKSYWRSRVGNLTDFIWRLPEHPMPENGKPAMANLHERVEDQFIALTKYR